jgi:hypothetical protein
LGSEARLVRTGVNCAFSKQNKKNRDKLYLADKKNSEFI